VNGGNPRIVAGLIAAALLFPLAPEGNAQAEVDRTLERQVLMLFEQEEWEKAEALLMDVLTNQPEASQVLAWLGTARYMNRRYRTAEAPLRKAVELGQTDLGTQYYLASTLWENGRLAEAEAFCRQAIEVSGEQLPLVHLLGRLHLWQGEFGLAREWLERAVAMSPRSLDLWLDLAGALAGEERTEEALNAYRRAVELAPEHYQVRYGLARMLARSGDSAGAARELALYRELLEEDQGLTQQQGLLQSQIDLGYELLRQGQTTQAIAHLEALPINAEVLSALASAYDQLGDRKAALDALERAVAMAPDRQDLRARLAVMRLRESAD
jgi:Flp pilus assembly protein TadD